MDLVTSDERGLIIRDYKTSKQLDDSFGKMLAPFKMFKDSNWNKYSLQLLVYAYIVEKATGVKAYKLEIVKLAEDGYKVVPINPDMKIVFDYLVFCDKDFIYNINRGGETAFELLQNELKKGL